MYIVLGNSLSVVFKLHVYCFGQLFISSIYVKPKNSLGQLPACQCSVYYYGSYTGCLPLLSTLQIAHNKLKTAQDIEELAHCPSLRYLIIILYQPSVTTMMSSLHHCAVWLTCPIIVLKMLRWSLSSLECLNWWDKIIIIMIIAGVGVPVGDNINFICNGQKFQTYGI